MPEHDPTTKGGPGGPSRRDFFRGSGLAVWRLLKCHPFHSGGHDPLMPEVTNRGTAE